MVEVVKSEKTAGYPLLMKHNSSELIVLFTEENKGVVVCEGDTGDSLGYYYDEWNQSAFSIFNGEIKLRNK